MKNEYEQLEIDTRNDLERALSEITTEVIADALDLIDKNCATSSDNLMPKTIRNKHEAYGVAAEQTVNIDVATKLIKKDVQELLGILHDPNHSAIETTGSICNSMAIAAERLIQAAAIMKRTMNHLYAIEADRPTPLDEYMAENEEFEEAELLEADEEDTED